MEENWRIFKEYLELNQIMYCLEFDDIRIATLTKEQYEKMEHLLKTRAENERLTYKLDIIKEGVLMLSDNLDNTEFAGENAAQEHDRQQWRGERIMNERVLKVIEQALNDL